MDIQNITVKIIDTFTNNRVLVEELTQLDAPKLVYNGADDKYQTIMTSEFQFNLFAPNNWDGEFFHLFTGNERRYYVTVEDNNTNILFEGYLLPDFYQEPYTNSVMFVSLTATDCVAGLKSKYIDNHFYKEEVGVVKLIAECLKLTGLQKEIHLSPAIMSAATNYLWHEIFVNAKEYLEGEIKPRPILNFEPEKLPARKNAYEILDLLLKSLGCTLYAWGEIWYVEGINRKHEISQFTYRYDYDGIYLGTTTNVKNIVNADNRFLVTPTISVVSPWKRVFIKWDCNEDGNLIPEWGIQDLKSSLQQGVIAAPSFLSPDIVDYLDFWNKNGKIQYASTSSNYNVTINGLVDIGQVLSGSASNTPLTIEYTRPIVMQVSLDLQSNETITDWWSSYFSIKKPKYLKKSDEYINRTYEIKIELLGGNFYGKALLDGTENNIKNEQLARELYKIDFSIKNLSQYKLLLTTKSINENPLNEKKVTIKDTNVTLSNLGSVPGLPSHRYMVVRQNVNLEFENELGVNGFLDMNLRPVKNYNLTNDEWFTDYLIHQLSFKIAEIKTWEDTLTRNIDFTTEYELEIFHGDSIADLTEKQWRLRRYIPPPTSLPGQVTIISSENTIITVGLVSVPLWKFYISAQQAQDIMANPLLLNINLPAPYGDTNLNQLLLNPQTGASNYGITWGVNNQNGLWFISIIPSGQALTIGYNLFASSSWYLNNAGPAPFYGWVFEDNEWRESWKRFGKTENIRYGLALGKIYHDVQSEALAKIEGTVVDLINPREIVSFYWMNAKEFIPLRLTLNFSTGKTDLLLMESKINDVNDYLSEYGY